MKLRLLIYAKGRRSAPLEKERTRSDTLLQADVMACIESSGAQSAQLVNKSTLHISAERSWRNNHSQSEHLEVGNIATMTWCIKVARHWFAVVQPNGSQMLGHAVRKSLTGLPNIQEITLAAPDGVDHTTCNTGDVITDGVVTVGSPHNSGRADMLTCPTSGPAAGECTRLVSAITER